MATFGKTAIGTTTAGVAWPSDATTLSACQFNLSDNNALVTKLTTYSSTLSLATEWRGVIYDDSSNTPNSVIAITAPASIVADSFVNLPFVSSFNLNSGNYWLGVMANGTALTSTDVAGPNRIATGITYPTPPSPFPGGAASTFSANQKTIYATYTVPSTLTVRGTAILIGI